jgi:hypothetical protein
LNRRKALVPKVQDQLYFARSVEMNEMLQWHVECMVASLEVAVIIVLAS